MTTENDDSDENAGGMLISLANGMDDESDPDVSPEDDGPAGPLTRRRRPSSRPAPRRAVRADLQGDEEVTGAVRSAETRLRNRIEEDLEDFYGSLNFGTDSHSVMIERLEPKMDDDGEPISGHLGTFHEKMEIDDVKAKFGGGYYKLTLRGPDSRTGRGTRIKGSKHVRIAGPPKAKKPAEGGGKIDGIVETLLSNKERDLQRLSKEASDSRNMMLALLTKKDETVPLMMKMMEDQKREAKESMNPILQMIMATKQDEQARLAREETLRVQREAEQAKLEAAREKERTERLRIESENKKMEELAAQRRHEQMLKTMELQQQQQQQQSQTMMTLMMSMFQATAKNEKDSSQVLLKMMSDNGSQAIAQAQAMMAFQGNMFQSALQDAKDTNKSKGAFGETLENLAALKDVFRMFNGQGEPDDRPGWERAIDKIGETLPTLGATVSQFLQQNKQLQLGAPQPQTTGPMAPGTVVVAEINEPPQVTGGNKQKPEQQSAKPAQQPENTQQEPTQTEQTVDNNVVNDFTEVVIPPAGMDLEQQAIFLVKDLDFAIQNDWEPEKIVSDIFNKFPPMITTIILAQKADVMIKQLGSKIPETWALLSPKGEDILRDAYDLLKESSK
jgi:hypothetical protein